MRKLFVSSVCGLALLAMSFLSCSMDADLADKNEQIVTSADASVSRGLKVYSSSFEGVSDGWFGEEVGNGFDAGFVTRDWASVGLFSLAQTINPVRGEMYSFYKVLPAGMLKPSQKISVDVRRGSAAVGFQARIRIQQNWRFDGKSQIYSDWKVVYASGDGRHLTYTIPNNPGFSLDHMVLYVDITPETTKDRDIVLYIDNVLIEQ